MSEHLTGDSPLDQYHEFLHHNELQLASQGLEALGDDRNAPPAFWSALADAVDEMRLKDAARRYRLRAGG